MNYWKLKVLVQPGARSNQVAGVHDGRLKIKIQAPPVDGKANEMLLKFLAGELGIKSSRLELEKGQSSRSKTLLLTDVSEILWNNFLKRYNHFN